MHTPGPWTVDPDDRPNMEWNNHIYAANGLAVCFMAHSDGKDVDADEANARLIAAAPDMLAALRAFVLILDKGSPIDLIRLISDAGKQARAAIAKATQD